MRLTILILAAASFAGAAVRTCESLKTVILPNTTIESVTEESHVCRVTATVTHPPAGDRIRIWIALPATWNGRFEGLGGGGFSGGSANSVAAPAALGWAAASTDTGHEGGSGSFALDENNRLKWSLIRDNAYLGIHEMTVTGKQIAALYYGRQPSHSYFNGCSTGGRQGLSEAQRYPADYDGILSGAPAINWTKLHVEQMWGNLVMKELKNLVAPCKFEAAQAASVVACDAADGVRDGVIDDPRKCDYDPKALVGTTTDCGAFTETDAEVVRRIWQGPRRHDGNFLWYGLPRGASFLGLSAPDRPNGITLEWWRYFLTQNREWDWHGLDWLSYEQYWDQSVEEFSAVLATDNPDLTAFRDRGGKLVLWHGWSDQLIYPEGTIDYYSRVQDRMGGPDATSRFARLFLAPGVGHCAGGAGPAPDKPLDAVVAWVETGAAPETLPAVRRDNSGAVVRSRPLCPYPLTARYKGAGSTDDAGNFTCVAP